MVVKKDAKNLLAVAKHRLATVKLERLHSSLALA